MKDKTQRELIEEIWVKLMTSSGITPKQILTRRLLEVATVAVVLGLIGLGVALLFAGKLTPEDIARILQAWRG